MKNLFNRRNARPFDSKGFTLIELLIVIVIIGILAIAVLSVLNPVELINRGNDSARESVASDTLSAFERYFVNMGEYPWEPDEVEIAEVPAASGTPLVGGDGEPVAWLDNLTAISEVKEEFMDRPQLADLEVFTYNDGNSVRVCFAPASDTFAEMARHDHTGAVNETDPTRVCLPR